MILLVHQVSNGDREMENLFKEAHCRIKLPCHQTFGTLVSRNDKRNWPNSRRKRRIMKVRIAK